MAKRRKDRVRPTPADGNTGAAIVAAARTILGEGWTYCSPSDLGRRCVDCSGFTRIAVQRATGIELSPDSHEQLKAGQPVPAGEERDGDLAFFDTAGGGEVRGGNAASHVGIRAGGHLLNALNPSLGIRESDLSSDYWQGKTGDRVRYLGARRLVGAAGVEEHPTPRPHPPGQESAPPSQNGPEERPTPAGSFTLPTGPVRTPAPWGSFNTDWSAITRWWPQIAAAAAETAAPADRLVAHIVIESQGGEDAHQVNPRNGDSWGLTQVVPYGVGWEGWHALVAKLGGVSDERGAVLAALRDPAVNLRVGAAILRTFYDTHRSWDAASSAFFTGTGDWNGQDSVNGTTGNAYKRALDGLMAEIAAAAPASKPPPGPVPNPKPTPDPTGPLVFGRVSHPPFQDRIIQNNTAWDDLGQRTIRGVVLHRMIGTLWGTDSYFRGQAAGSALTDVGVGVLATDGARDDGTVIRWNDPLGRRAPWASGPWENPPGDGRAFVAKYGVNAINRDLVSIEISGNYDTPISPKAIDSVCRMLAYWADQTRVPWDRYPISPVSGLTTLYWHNEFQNHKPCPGLVLMDATAGIIDRVRTILGAAQTGDASNPKPPPATPDLGKVAKVMLPPGVTVGDLREWFGSEFNPNGPVTVLWAEDAAKSGRYPKLVRVDPPGDVRDFWFEGGYVIRSDKGGVRSLRVEGA